MAKKLHASQIDLSSYTTLAYANSTFINKDDFRENLDFEEADWTLDSNTQKYKIIIENKEDKIIIKTFLIEDNYYKNTLVDEDYDFTNQLIIITSNKAFNGRFVLV